MCPIVKRLYQGPIALSLGAFFFNKIGIFFHLGTS